MRFRRGTCSLINCWSALPWLQIEVYMPEITRAKSGLKGTILCSAQNLRSISEFNAVFHFCHGYYFYTFYYRLGCYQTVRLVLAIVSGVCDATTYPSPPRICLRHFEVYWMFTRKRPAYRQYKTSFANINLRINLSALHFVHNCFLATLLEIVILLFCLYCLCIAWSEGVGARYFLWEMEIYVDMCVQLNFWRLVVWFDVLQYTCLLNVYSVSIRPMIPYVRYISNHAMNGPYIKFHGLIDIYSQVISSLLSLQQ